MKPVKIHLAYQRGPESTLYDARCGIWHPKEVSSFINAVTCKGCLRMADSDLKNTGDLRHGYRKS